MTLAQITNKIREIDFDNILDEIERKENEGGAHREDVDDKIK